MPGPLNRHCCSPLMFLAQARSASTNNSPPLGNQLSQPINIFKIRFSLGLTKTTHPPPYWPDYFPSMTSPGF